MGLEETVGRNERLFEVWSSLLFTLVTPTTKPKDRNVKKKTVGRKERLDEYRLATALTNSQKSVPQYIYYINSLDSGLLGKDFCGLGLQSRAPKKKWGGKEKRTFASLGLQGRIPKKKREGEGKKKDLGVIGVQGRVPNKKRGGKEKRPWRPWSAGQSSTFRSSPAEREREREREREWERAMRERREREGERGESE